MPYADTDFADADTDFAFAAPTMTLDASLPDLAPHRAAERARVLIADADQLAGRALIDSLRADGGFTVIGHASTGTEVVELARHYRPHVVLIAAGLAGLDAIAACEQIAAISADIRVVMLATAPDLALETRALRAGAAGFVIKTAEVESIARALAVVRAGHSLISPELTGMLIERLRRTPVDGTGTRPVKSALTTREWEILDFLCAGQSTREIADTLYLSPETVKSHVKSVLRKLGVNSRTAAVAAASMLRAEILV